MRIEGHKRAARKLRDLPEAARANIAKAVRLSTEEGARVARTLAPNVTGATRAQIETEFREGGMVGEVVVISSDADRAEKDKAYSIEHGRKAGNRGTTAGFHFVHVTRQFLGKKHRARIKRALAKAVKEVSRGG